MKQVTRNEMHTEFLVGKPPGKSPLWRLQKSRDIINVHLKDRDVSRVWTKLLQKKREWSDFSKSDVAHSVSDINDIWTNLGTLYVAILLEKQFHVDCRFNWLYGMVQCVPDYHVSLRPIQWVTAADGGPIDTHEGSMHHGPTASHLVVKMWSTTAWASYLSR